MSLKYGFGGATTALVVVGTCKFQDGHSLPTDAHKPQTCYLRVMERGLM